MNPSIADDVIQRSLLELLLRLLLLLHSHSLPSEFLFDAHSAWMAAITSSTDGSGLPACFALPRVPAFLAPHVLNHAVEAPIEVRLVAAPSSWTCLIWSYDDCVRLRRKWKVAVSPVGNCPQKIATNGKLAAIPVVIEDDVLYLGAHLGWWRIVDSASGTVVDPWTVLEHNAHAPGAASLLQRRIVFADLWAKGYRMTNGIKFGVDYLAYRADPSMCHAAFMVMVLALDVSGGANIASLDLVTRSRVATTALKICVLAYVDTREGPSRDAVSFAAFRRMGPGHVAFFPLGTDFVTVGASRWALVGEEEEETGGRGEDEGTRAQTAAPI